MDTSLSMKDVFKYSVLLVILLMVPMSAAGEVEDLFQEGNGAYQAGDYDAALQSYQQILDSGYESGPLYFNLGNCYYKQQQIGKSILFYERTRRLMPGDEDLQANLALANLAVVDRIEPQEDFLLIRIVRGAIHLLPLSGLVGLLGGAYLFLAGFMILWIVSRKGSARLMGVRFSVFFGVLFLIFALCLVGRLRDDARTVEGVIMEDKVDVMSAPGGDGVEVFSLHEGTKVRIDQETNDWVEIVLPDRKVGWVQRQVLEII